jgi:ATP-dependent exoDNAse (exonuclease V) beta subunit
MAELLSFPKSTPDAQPRLEALDTTHSFLVEAPAGSGKTGLLIQRYLKLLAAEDITDPAQVLAITFTRKATGELRERVLLHLNAAARGTPAANDFDHATRALASAVLTRDAALGWGLLDQPARLNLRTIDSVCVDIARALPVLSGSAGTLAPSEDAKPLHAEAARRTVMFLGGEDAGLSQAIEQMLLHRDGSLTDLESLIANMLATREQWLGMLPSGTFDDATLDREVLPRMEHLLDQVICRSLTHLGQLMPPDLQHRFARLAARLGNHPPHASVAESPIAICRELTAAPGQAAVDLAYWSALAYLAVTPSSQTWRKSLQANHLKFELPKKEKPELADIIAECAEIPGLLEALCDLSNLPPAQYPPEQWRVARHLIRILAQALTELQQVFAARGQCDFSEIALVARRALRNDADGQDLARATGLRFRHLLVDEMQDTSTGQYELIELLTRTWHDGQTVFLVGDPKQSIYRFRQARVERFLATMRTGRLGSGIPRVEVLRLGANFRSRPGLVRHFNEDFSQIFQGSPASGPAPPTHPEAVHYQPAHAVREDARTNDRQWHPTRLPHDSDPAARQTQADQDAAEMVEIIREWRARPLPSGRTKAWTIAILARSRPHFAPVVAALKLAGIPFRAVEIDPLGERQEILDLLALTRALLHAADRTAWLALLRTPWCGLTLADLHTVAAGDETLWSERTLLDAIATRGEELSPDGIERLTPFWTIMTRALAQRGQLPLSAWVAQTWLAFGSPAYATPEELSNIERYFALLDEIAAASAAAMGTIDLPTLERRLEDLYAVPLSDTNAIDLMTIHGAKGLEWDVVLVPALERKSGSNGGRLLDWLEMETEEDGAAAGIFAPIKSKGGDSHQLNQWIRSVEGAREAAERKRLFYVVATRAREELHLFAAPVEKKDGGISLQAGSLLQAAWSAAEPVFATAQPGQLITMPAPAVLESLAAAPAPRIIQRLPLPLQPPIPSEASEPSVPARPEGSFAARIFGNAMHAFLEQLAHRLAAGLPARALLAEIATWQPRIAAVLRAGGIGPAELDRFTGQVLTGLRNTLNDAEGLWLLQPHPGAESETAFTTLNPAGDVQTLRLDRTFLAGAAPTDPGSDYRWIVDFKTSSHSPQGLDAWLETQRQSYAPQLERYAAAFAESKPVRLALFYPILPKLLWWPLTSSTG